MITRRQTLAKFVASTTLALAADRRGTGAPPAAVARQGTTADGGGLARIRIGQIGVGHGHATKLAVYRQSPEYEVVGIVEPDASLRARAEKQPAFQGLPWMSQDDKATPLL